MDKEFIEHPSLIIGMAIVIIALVFALTKTITYIKKMIERHNDLQEEHKKELIGIIKEVTTVVGNNNDMTEEVIKELRIHATIVKNMGQ